MNIGIAGAGLLGRLLAYELLQKGHHITLFDKDDQRGEQSCGFVAAGMVAPYSELGKREKLIFTLGMQAFDYWETLAQKLNQPQLFKKLGSVVLAYPQDSAELQRFRDYVLRQLPHETLDFLDRSTLSQLEPELQTHLQAFYLPHEANVNTVLLFEALKNYFLDNTVDWHTASEVIHIEPQRIHTHQRQYSFDVVFDCRGLGAHSTFPQLRGLRGELLWLHAPDVNITHTLHVMHPRHPIYVVPRAKHHFVVGASEIESSDMSPISVRTTLELLTTLYAIHTGFAEARIIRTLVNCRPALPDNLPKIQSEKGFIAINGLYRHGYLLAPAMIQQAMHALSVISKLVRFR